MIQDIYPAKFDNHFEPLKPREEDTALLFDPEGKVFVRVEHGRAVFPKMKEIPQDQGVFLFRIDEERFFLVSPENAEPKEGYVSKGIRELRRSCTGAGVFAAYTGYHLWRWYSDHQFCGRCGERTGYHPTERALCCESCGNVIYPRINPAVIVGVTRGDELLITRYRQGYQHNALVAGFTEIGETLEQTVEREVMEETGVRVKNIRYYKSQPWGIAQDLLVGYFCDAEGDGEIRMDTGELKYAEWTKREAIELQPDNMSLTNEMMTVFKEKREPGSSE